MPTRIRKIVTLAETTEREMGHAITPPARKAVAAAVIANPCAGRYVQDLSELIETGARLGDLLAREAMALLRVGPEAIQGYGKAALVGESGELEHAAALLHPSLGAPLRAAIGGGAALVPSSKAMGGPGDVIDVPLGHKDAAYVRSHFDGMRLRVSDAPRPDEIVVAVALTTGGRPLPRVGGLTHDTAEGKDGLR
ncbi:amino acid synthesis family protein [Marinibacterium profundimaris]|uniref:Peptide synthetase n=1 Tax=Marinibacterium profundimaris TaxID=1679460 RepID=A0A225NL34_9RHOB|nr:amino acid synthesis family protein [Marinibacterium profundimaris]OWU74905.1 peptide synthetase [Marinibacterium profundimaris]